VHGNIGIIVNKVIENFRWMYSYRKLLMALSDEGIGGTFALFHLATDKLPK
jgi:hypothetical protein